MNTNRPIFFQLPPSKSILNRALIIQSYRRNIEAIALNTPHLADDSVHLLKSLKIISGAAKEFNRPQQFYVGDGGTTLRFLALRLARIPGIHTITGTQRLFNRPNSELIKLLQQLGVEVLFDKCTLTIKGNGIQNPKGPIRVSSNRSGQFLSSLFLNSWDLPFEIEIAKPQKMVSQSYIDLTLKMVKKSGLSIKSNDSSWSISAHQIPNSNNDLIEGDVSSGFVMASIGACSEQRTIIDNFPQASLQPDYKFLDIFKRIGINYNFISKNQLEILPSSKNNWQPINFNLEETPDLFPVLAILCGHITGTSQLLLPKHLKYKESNRILKTLELLSLLQIPYKLESETLYIEGNPNLKNPITNFLHFNPDSDHRMAFAATLANVIGHKVIITTPEVVEKSFPNFWTEIGKYYDFCFSRA